MNEIRIAIIVAIRKFDIVLAYDEWGAMQPANESSHAKKMRKAGFAGFRDCVWGACILVDKVWFASCGWIFVSCQSSPGLLLSSFITGHTQSLYTETSSKIFITKDAHIQLHRSRRLIKSDQSTSRNLAPPHNDIRARHHSPRPILHRIHTFHIFTQHTLDNRRIADSYVVDSKSPDRRCACVD
jgi:hypothetical protein